MNPTYDHYRKMASRAMWCGIANTAATLAFLMLAGVCALLHLAVWCVICAMATMLFFFGANVCFHDRAYFAKRRDIANLYH